MLLEIFILFEVLALVLFFTAWFRQSIILWALSLFIFGVQIFTSYNIVWVIHEVGLSGVTSYVTSLNFPILSFINIAFFVFSLLFMFWDIFDLKNSAGARP